MGEGEWCDGRESYVDRTLHSIHHPETEGTVVVTVDFLPEPGLEPAFWRRLHYFLNLAP